MSTVYMVSVLHTDNTGGRVEFTDKEAANKFLKVIRDRVESQGSTITTSTLEKDAIND